MSVSVDPNTNILAKKPKKKLEKKLTPSEEIVDQLNADLANYLDIWHAASTGNLAVLETTLAPSLSVNTNAPLSSALTKLDDFDPISQMSALHIAAQNNFIDICRLLLANGANVNLPSGTGMTALMYASQHPDALELVSFLLHEYNASVRNLDKSGNGVIVAAIRGGNLRVFDALVAKGADVNTANRQGIFPIMQAALAGQLSILEALARAGASVESQDRDGNTALHYACMAGNAKAVRVLVTVCSAQVGVVNAEGLTPAQVASSTEAAQALLTKRADTVDAK